MAVNCQSRPKPCAGDAVPKQVSNRHLMCGQATFQNNRGAISITFVLVVYHAGFLINIVSGVDPLLAISAKLRQHGRIGSKRQLRPNRCRFSLYSVVIVDKGDI